MIFENQLFMDCYHFQKKKKKKLKRLLGFAGTQKVNRSRHKKCGHPGSVEQLLMAGHDCSISGTQRTTLVMEKLAMELFLVICGHPDTLLTLDSLARLLTSKRRIERRRSFIKFLMQKRIINSHALETSRRVPRFCLELSPFFLGDEVACTKC